jgi:23S rRNA pseudouridine2605 synthase
MRINQFLARSGVASRRGVEGLILGGAVTVNGQVLTDLAVQVDADTDVVCVSGQRVRPEPPVYLLLNKPSGYISAVSDPQGRPVVIDLIRDCPVKAVPVGRLDFNTTGCLLLSNDGDFIQRLLHPSFEIAKTYQAEVEGQVNQEVLRSLLRGVMLEEGWAHADAVTCLRERENSALLEIVIHQGWKRQVKRMCAAVGLPVRRLHRSAIAFLTVEGLAEGAYRCLTPAEVERLNGSV